MKFKKFLNKIFVHMKTFDVTIDHILVHFIGSKVGLYVSFLICLYIFWKHCLKKINWEYLIRDIIRKLKCQLETYNSNANSKSLRTHCGATTRVSVQGVKSLGGHFACLCRGFEFYEVKKNFCYYFSKRKCKYFYTFNHFYSEKSSKRAK